MNKTIANQATQWNDDVLVIASNRHEADGTDFDICLSQRRDGVFETPQPLAGDALTRAYEADPFVAPDGSYILFSSSRRDGAGRRDLYTTFRRDDGASSRAVALGSGVNSAGIESAPSSLVTVGSCPTRAMKTCTGSMPLLSMRRTRNYGRGCVAGPSASRMDAPFRFETA